MSNSFFLIKRNNLWLLFFFFLSKFTLLMGIASLWFVWVCVGLRKVNELEIGLVLVCIFIVCFV